MPGFMPKNRFQVCYKDGDGNFAKLGSFRNVGGISAETEQTDWKTGDMLATLKVPGETKFGALTLKKGVDANKKLGEWRDNIYSGSCDQGEDYRDVYILIIDRACIVQRVIHASNAWPSKYELEELDSMSSDALLESVELSHSGWAYAKDANDAVNGGSLIGAVGSADAEGNWTSSLVQG